MDGDASEDNEEVSDTDVSIPSLTSSDVSLPSLPSMTESVMEFMGFFNPRKIVQIEDEISTSTSLNNDNSDLSLFLSEVNKGIVDISLNEEALDMDTPSPDMAGSGQRKSVVRDETRSGEGNEDLELPAGLSGNLHSSKDEAAKNTGLGTGWHIFFHFLGT